MTEPNTTEAPSVDDCESPNSANSVATSQGDVPVDDSDGIPASEHYWQTVSDLAPDITRAAKTILSNKRPHFKKVVAVIAYWESASGLDHLRAQADKLGRLFKDDFKFEVLVYKIPDNVEDWEFISIIGGELCKVSKDRDGLFILYYGGPICSKLFIFDCCHAGGMIDPTLAWETSCELLGACAADVQASSLHVSSFTAALLQEMPDNTFNVCEYNLAQFPHYQDFVGPCRRGESASALIKKVTSPVESENRPRTAPDVLHRLTTMTDAAVCVAITFKCTAEAFMVESQAIQKNWQKWFRFAPTEVDDVIVQACREPPPTGCKRYDIPPTYTQIFFSVRLHMLQSALRMAKFEPGGCVVPLDISLISLAKQLLPLVRVAFLGIANF
ncbi:hypothetical protein X797_008655 [Metarhizium robertsii]|uniref:Uncharacterized protein n=1 Tax=Metarhizium robertsii TaxID=568076 RepID=A0A014P6S6_9HYPO|nr:hypothetical protein X797_008655 [Metarhizium robertsii]